MSFIGRRYPARSPDRADASEKRTSLISGKRSFDFIVRGMLSCSSFPFRDPSEWDNAGGREAGARVAQSDRDGNDTASEGYITRRVPVDPARGGRQVDGAFDERSGI